MNFSLKLLSVCILFLSLNGFAQVNPSATLDLEKSYVVFMNDGTKLKGKVISQTRNSFVFKDANLGELTIQRKKINSMDNQYGRDKWIFNLKDGSKLTGVIADKNDTVTIIETENFGKLNVQNDKIVSLKEFDDASITNVGKIWFRNPNATRYLIGPSAIPLKKGEGYYQNIYGAINSWNIGLTKNFSMGGGLVGPLGIYVTPKLAFKINDLVHLGVGILYANSFFPIGRQNFGFGMGYGMMTFGNHDHNLTVSGGVGFASFLGKTYSQNLPTISISGATRIARKFSIVSENWFVPFKNDVFAQGDVGDHHELFFSYAARFMGETSTFDFGFVNTPALIDAGWFVGIPYLGFVIRFGKYKDEDE